MRDRLFHDLLKIILLVTLATAMPAGAAETAQFILGTATKGGGFQLFGQTLIEVINAADGAVRIQERQTKGSTENLALLLTGDIDLGLVEGNAAHDALTGNTATGLKVLAVMYPNPGMFVVRADSPYRTIADLQGKPIAFGTKASGLRILAHDVLSGLGLDPERDFQQVILDKAGDGPGLVLDNKVAALWGAGIGWPGFVAVAESTGGARFIAPSAAQIAQILQSHPHLKPMSVPAGTYLGQDRQIDSIGLWSLIMLKPGTTDAAAYSLARAIHQSQAALATQLQQAVYTTARNTVANVPLAQMHPGALRFYRELGIVK